MSDPVETVLCSTFQGLNRVVSETELNEAQSPDCTDCRNTDRKTGQLGPRLGRQRFSTSTYSLLGMGMLVAPFGRFKILADTNGDWTASAVAWAGVTPGAPTTATARAVNQDGTNTPMDTSAGVRFIQYGTRIIAYNGRNRPLTFDGNRWRNLGIIGGIDSVGLTGGQFTPTITLTGGTTLIPAFGARGGGGNLVVTLTTSVAHGLVVGQRVTVNVSDSIFNGTYAIATVPSTTTFTYSTVANGAQATESITGTITVLSSSVQITNMVVSGTNLGTITTASAHGFVTGDTVLFTDLNGTTNGGPKALVYGSPGVGTFTATPAAFTVTYISTTTFSIVMVGATNFAGDATLITAQGCYVHKVTTAVAGITGTYYYYVVAACSTKLDVNGRMVEGLPSVRSAVASPTAQSVTISWTPTSHVDPQVDKWNIYRTLNGGFDSGVVAEFQDFFLLATVAVGTNTYTDTIADSSLWYQLADTSNRLRFTTNIPPTFKIAAVYGERVFAAGFDPINSSTVTTASSATVTLAAGTWPDGVKGCYFRQDADDTFYEIKASSTTTLTLDRTFTGSTGSGKHYTIYRNPNEVWFSEYQSPDAWGRDGEFNRLKLPIPPDKEITGLFPFQGSLLVFTSTEIWAIYGMGTNRFDVKKLRDAACVDAGAVSQDTIFRSGNECHFLSLDGPASIDSVGTSINVKLYGIPLNVDWMDSLTATETKIACAGTDGRAIWYSVPSASGQTLNSKTYRFERDTGGWFEETEMCPTRFIRQDGTDGYLQQLFYIQDRFVHKPQYGTLDLVSAALGPSQAGTSAGTTATTYDIRRAVTHGTIVSNVVTITSTAHGFSDGDSVILSVGNADYDTTGPITGCTANTFSYNSSGADGDTALSGTVYRPVDVFPTTSGGLEQVWVRFYWQATGVSTPKALYAARRITSNTAYVITWSNASTLPYLGLAGTITINANFTYEIGNIGWKWLSKAVLIPGHRKTSESVYVTFTKSASATILTNDVIDDAEATNINTISCANKVESKVGVSGSNLSYQMRLASRTGAVIQDVTLKSLVEEDI